MPNEESGNLPTVLNNIQHWESEGRERKRAWMSAGYAIMVLVAPVLAILLLSGSPQVAKAQGTDSSTSTTPTLIAE